jgi:hypothetical protein
MSYMPYMVLTNKHRYIKIKTNTLYVLYALYGFNKQPIH